MEKTEVFINGEWISYDGCTQLGLTAGKKFYKGWKFIGSSHLLRINGVESSWPNLHHFFKLPETLQL